MSDRKSKLLSLAARANPFDHIRHSSTSQQHLSGDSSMGSPRAYRPSFESNHYSDPYASSHGHEPLQQLNNDDLLPPHRPFSTAGLAGDGSGLSSRRSSFSSSKDDFKERPPSLSINYVPTKFTKLHEPGDYLHRRAKTGGGRDAFASDASRMGMPGTVDDDEGVVFQLGKGGLKQKTKPKLRWNRFKWILFVCNTFVLAYGIAFLIAAILVWLNVFYRSDVIRTGNTNELIISTVAAAVITLTSLIGYSGIILNNRAFLAIYTLFLWISLALLVAPGYMTYKQKTFNLEGKINLQWSRNLGTEGRLRIQNALNCCGYYSPFVEATQSPLCYARSNFPGCKNTYMKLERHVLTTWYTISFALVPAHIGITIAALLCSNHITYRFGKGLTPKRYRLDLGSMAIIMDEYAGQIAEKYGSQLAHEAMNRSSSYLIDGQRQSLSLPSSRRGSTSNLAAMSSGASVGVTRPTSRFAPSTATTGLNSHSGTYASQGGMSDTASTGYNSQPGYAGQGGRGQDGLYDPSSDVFEDDVKDPSYMDNETDAVDSMRYQDSDYSHDGRQGGYDQARGGHGWAR